MDSQTDAAENETKDADCDVCHSKKEILATEEAHSGDYEPLASVETRHLVV